MKRPWRGCGGFTCAGYAAATLPTEPDAESAHLKIGASSLESLLGSKVSGPDRAPAQAACSRAACALEPGRTILPMKKKVQRTVGWWEWVVIDSISGLPVRAKVDTGAETSSLHAERLSVIERDGALVARFTFRKRRCEVPVLELRPIKSSNGSSALRPIVMLGLRVAGAEYETQFSLADRSEMRFPVLLGREALAGRFLVDAGAVRLLGTAREAARLCE